MRENKYENVIFRLTKQEKENIKNEVELRGMTITGLIKVALREYLSKK